MISKFINKEKVIVETTDSGLQSRKIVSKKGNKFFKNGKEVINVKRIIKDYS